MEALSIKHWKEYTMGRNDIATRRFFENNRYFADAVNGYLYQGNPVIAPEDLRELDTTETVSDKKNTRDVMKEAVIREAGGKCFALIGIENQQKIDLSMPIRVMRADVMRYDNQLRQLEQIHREKGDLEVGSDEHFSGIGREDRLRPVFTIVVYWGSRPWDGPRCLRDMLEVDHDAVFGRSVSDYELHIIDAHSMNNDQLSMYGDDLGFLLTLVRESADAKGLHKFLSSCEKVLDSEEAVCVAEQVIGCRMPRDGKEDTRMCEAFQEILRKERAVGLEQGREEGMEKGMESMIEAMRKNGLSEEQIEAVLKTADSMKAS